VALVYIPALLRPLTGAETVEAEGATVGEVLDALEQKHPGLRERLLKPNIAIAVDGEVIAGGLREPVSPGSEVHFVTAIKGGTTGWSVSASLAR
jgi:molybdopterin synthase sulfur carrier subunit